MPGSLEFKSGPEQQTNPGDDINLHKLTTLANGPGGRPFRLKVSEDTLLLAGWQQFFES